MSLKNICYQSQIFFNEIEKSNYFKKKKKNLKFSSQKDSPCDLLKKTQSDFQRKLLNQVKFLQKQNKSLKTQMVTLKEENQQLANKIRYFFQLENFFDFNKNQKSQMLGFHSQFKISDYFLTNMQAPTIHINFIQNQNKQDQQRSINLNNKVSSSTTFSQSNQGNSIFLQQEQLQSGAKQCIQMYQGKIAQISETNKPFQQRTRIYEKSLSIFKQGQFQIRQNISYCIQP